MVAGDVAHSVVRAIGCLRLLDNICDVAHRAALVYDNITRGVIEVEVELSVDHTALDIRADKLNIAIGLANLPELTVGHRRFHLVGEHTPIVQGDVLASIVAEAVELEFAHPHECRVGHRLTHLVATGVESGDVLVEPGGQTGFAVPQTNVLAAIGQNQVGGPIGVLFQHGRVDVEVVGHIVENHVHLAFVGLGKHCVQLLIGAKTLVDNGAVNRPIAVVAREFGVGIAVLAPRIVGVLGDGRNPDGGNAEVGEETVLNLLGDTHNVATLIVYFVQHLGRVDFPVVVGGTVVETVDHQRVENLRLEVFAGDILCILHHFATLQGEQHVVETATLRGGKYAHL